MKKARIWNWRNTSKSSGIPTMVIGITSSAKCFTLPGTITFGGYWDYRLGFGYWRFFVLGGKTSQSSERIFGWTDFICFSTISYFP
jgi:hypothetical protein